MKHGLRASPPHGFTIIEVLITLAIAGIFLLVVFEAIPTLSVNSRNNERKQDVLQILQAVSHYELNNSGNFPDCGYGTALHCFGPGNLLAYERMRYYTTEGSVVVKTFPPYVPGNPLCSNPGNSLDTVYVCNYQHCGATGFGSYYGSGYNDAIALYGLEGISGPPSTLCKELNY